MVFGGRGGRSAADNTLLYSRILPRILHRNLDDSDEPLPITTVLCFALSVFDPGWSGDVAPLHVDATITDSQVLDSSGRTEDAFETCHIRTGLPLPFPTPGIHWVDVQVRGSGSPSKKRKPRM